MTSKIIEEFELLQIAQKWMEDNNTDWMAIRTGYDSRKNLSLVDNIISWYHVSALPCTEIALEKNGELLTLAEMKECVPRPECSVGIIIARPKHDLLYVYAKLWVTSDDKRNTTRRNKVLKYIECGVLSAEQAALALNGG
jgi:hypothetical protein